MGHIKGHECGRNLKRKKGLRDPFINVKGYM